MTGRMTGEISILPPELWSDFASPNLVLSDDSGSFASGEGSRRCQITSTYAFRSGTQMRRGPVSARHSGPARRQACGALAAPFRSEWC